LALEDALLRGVLSKDPIDKNIHANSPRKR
jgi:hypothetical protein